MFINYTRYQITKAEIYLNGTKLNACSKFKYLGIWITPNCNENEQIKHRTNNCQNSYFSLNKIGISHIHCKTVVKSMLYKMYCRSILLYGVEVTKLNKAQLIKMRKCESMIIKKMTISSKYSSTNKITNALEITPLELEIETRKVRFFGQLLQNKFTYDLIRNIVVNNKIHPKSLIAEILSKAEGLENNTLDEIYEKLSEQQYVKKNMQANKFKELTSVAIRYLLDNRTKKNNTAYNLIINNIIKT
jgi:hypothetical protein